MDFTLCARNSIFTNYCGEGIYYFLEIHSSLITRFLSSSYLAV